MPSRRLRRGRGRQYWAVSKPIRLMTDPQDNILADSHPPDNPPVLAFTLLLGTMGGAVFAWFQLPLAWIIGSMVFCTGTSILGLPIKVPAGFAPA